MQKLTKQDIENILYQRIKSEKYSTLKDLPQPILFKDIEKASKRIVKAIQNNEKITIVGDYDVDGVTSSVILSDFFDLLKIDVEIIIPNRFTDGYGITSKIIERIESNLIITVDNGISAIDAAKLCKKKKIDLIITDHHKVGEELPEAYAIVNPQQNDCNFPFKTICGAEVVWYLIAQIKSEMQIKIDMSSFLDVLAIGIIGDVMPLIEINRILVKAGLDKMAISQKPAFIAMREILQIKKFNAELVSFQISPRLNSAGRIDSALLAFKFFKSKTIEEAYQYFEKLTNFNEERKEIEKDILDSSEKLVETTDKILVIYGENLHEGVIGIVASRLVDKYNKPAIIFSIDGENAKASARSLGEVNIYDLISTQMDILEKFGGHKLAAGLSLKTKNLDLFRKNINEEAKKLDKKLFIKHNNVLGEILMSEIDLTFIDMLDKFEPYGEANIKPKFNAKVKVYEFKKVGKNKEHLQLTILDKHTNTLHKCIKFRFQDEIQINQDIEIIFSVSRNEFMGTVNVQLLIDEIKSQDKF